MISAAATTSRTVATRAGHGWWRRRIGLPIGGGGLGIGTVIVLGLVSYAFGIDPRILIGGAEILTGGNQSSTYQTDRPSGQRKTGAPQRRDGQHDLRYPAARSTIAGARSSARGRQSYTGPKIVLFRNATNGGRCGMAQSAMGPFYCPPDQKIYLDTGFFREVENRFHGCSGNACKYHLRLYHRP